MRYSKPQKSPTLKSRIRHAAIKEGQPLMLDVLSADKGVLKITACVPDTDRNVQDGVKFLSAVLMRAISNPTAHGPALDWPINRDDALGVLSFVCFLFLAAG